MQHMYLLGTIYNLNILLVYILRMNCKMNDNYYSLTFSLMKIALL